jgi:superfamily II DNA or RNA helicase
LHSDYFAADYFDYIVIDEFHHAVSKQYQNILR